MFFVPNPKVCNPKIKRGAPILYEYDMVKMKKGSLILSILFLSVLIIQGCEDDPLLAPQTGSDEDKGSYGNLAPLQDFEEEIREKNPEIF